MSYGAGKKVWCNSALGYRISIWKFQALLSTTYCDKGSLRIPNRYPVLNDGWKLLVWFPEKDKEIDFLLHPF